MSKLRIFPNPRPSAFPLFLLHSPSFLFPHRRRNAVRPPSLCSRRNRHFQVRAKGNSPPGVRWLGIDADCGGDGGEELESPVDMCVTYELQPALTMRDGVRRIKEAVAEMKAKPPCCASGVVRFQVRIPPSINAVNWFCSQVKFSGVFPHFLIFLKNNKEVMEMASLDGMIGVSGVGAAIYLQGHSYATTEKNLIRYLSVDSTLIRAYGFIGINDMEGTFPANHKNEPHQIFIPQIELDEFESGSMLASTVIWDIHRFHKLQHAIQSVEFYLDKITCFGLSTNAPFNDKDLYEEDDLMLIKDAKMVYLHAENLVTQDTNSNGSQLEIFQDFFQSYFRLSDTLVYKNRMVTYSCESKFSIKDCPDINAVWSSLIVEECVRLGLKYFCVAPGSRSSPLATCAASHPLTTCTSCFDERSLAFHAVGYGKGSLKPAVVITTSGTAVSNLLPAVVEASQSFVPLLLLTADRPPELQDNGANQSINQVDHFGKFVRYFFSLPPASGEIPARMVLTTIDSAVYHATQVPCGPVHINCPFRETLEDYPSEWTFNCLKGLDKWISDSKPFTTYVNIQNFCSLAEHPSQVSEVLNLIERAERGLLLLGTMDTEDEIWAALLLARHLSWPVVADILSGMRLRRTFSSLQIDSQLLFIDHLDHALLSESFTKWVKPDVVLQLGSRLTSKRVAQFLESCSPSAYIIVDKHPYRHDPSHIVTQRIQSTVCAIAEALLNIQFTRKMVNWCNFLQAMDVTISQELSHQICLEDSLTEPYVAHIISEALQNGVLFVGNSMVIRDIDMYGKGLVESTSSFAPLSQDFPYQGIQVVGNRGVSGIDGLVSSACGFAVGCSKRVICVIGDVSFLHDTNGLAILSERMQRKPITILVMNNHGGAIFSFLPIAERTKSSILKKYFYASHDISIGNLCAAHSIKYLHVQTKGELHHALSESKQCSRDCVIEVESCISDNFNFHSVLRKSACQAVNQALNTLLLIRDHRNVNFSFLRIEKIEYSLYKIQLSSILTTTPITSEGKLDKKGFVLAITLSDGTRGFGEVAPIEIHKEKIEEVEEQLRFVIHMIEGSKINFLPSLCNGFFSSWFWRILGLTPSSLLPSVRCGIEMALLHALANKQDANAEDVFQRSENLFSGLTSLSASKGGKNIERPTHVEICALVDCSGTPSEVSHVVSQLVHECFTTIKLKVARRSNPIDDATVIQKIRNKVGYKVNIRVDANRKWTYEEAVLFGSLVQNFGLQYIEEPVQFEDDIIKFCEVTGLPVALDETVDDLKDDIVNKLKKFNHPGVVAIVIKPSVVGGFENAMLIASWALKHQKMAIISSAFESSLSLSVYSQFAVYLERQKIALCKTAGFNPTVAHGLGTYKWLSEDIGVKPFRNYIHPHCGALGISEKDSCAMLRNFQINDKVIQRSYSGEQLISYFSTINYHDCTFSMRLLETKSSMDNITVFLHGYLGTSEEWIPIMKALSAKSKCISIELPGHGQSKIQWNKEKEMSKEYQISIELVGDILHELLCGVTTGGVVLVGYSMGARIALYMSLKYNDKIKGAVLISGTPGLKDEASRNVRVDQDDAKAHFLSTHGLHHFIEIWYRSNLWNSLRCHPHFDRIKSARKKHDDIHAVAKALSDMSVGRQSSLWKELNYCSQPILLVVGEKDRKFKNIAHEMCKEIRSRDTDWSNVSAKLCTVVEVPECGHAVHLENPLVVINAVSKFLTKVRTE